MSKYQAPRGTHDVVPAESFAWQHIERTFAQVVSTYGFEEIRTPIFEDVELFIRSSGETSDVVSKQMYEFQDKGGRNICLKAEGTAPAMRACIEHNLIVPSRPLKLWYNTPVFRYERPQKGRYRQHHQLGIESLGQDSPFADAEVIGVAIRFLSQLGITGLSVKLNSIGKSEARADYRKALLDFAAPILATMEDEERRRAEQNPLRMLDSKNPAMIEHMSNAPSILDSLEPTSMDHLAKVQLGLTEQGIKFELAPNIVRGLDYYNDTVFEIQSDALGAQSTLCGGGRYDGLVKSLGGPATPAVGFGLGIERLAIVLEQAGLLPAKPAPMVYAFGLSDGANALIRRVSSEARELGLTVMNGYDDRSLKAHLRLADNLGCTYALFAGDDELTQNQMTLRHLAKGEQSMVPANGEALLNPPL